MSNSAIEKAMHFIENETQFHLGFLPTEQSSPLTRNMDKEFASSVPAGVRNLQSVDRNVLAMAKNIFASPNFKKLAAQGEKVIRNGGRIVFSGCGATGRLSILLESMWRKCCDELPEAKPYAKQVFSIMTGGDFALVKSVEFFEDYQIFGRRQVQELDLNSNDMLVAITEGGETSSVLGTLFEALDRDCQTFLLFNNPADLLVKHLERSKKAITDPRVCVLDLFCGPMALAGSTRMQATTSEQLVAGAALETIICSLTGREIPSYLAEFEQLLNELESPDNVQAMADYIVFETGLYKKKAYVTYFADDYMLDIFTDTTERSPTFMLPPFRKNDDAVSPRPWAFVKNPRFTTTQTWQNAMHRDLRCLEWISEDYTAMDAPEALRKNPPEINSSELLKFEIGLESTEDRTPTGNDAAVLMTIGDQTHCELEKAFSKVADKFADIRRFNIGQKPDGNFNITCNINESPLQLMYHMTVKLILNTISTGSMAVMSRVTGNWMSWVNLSNKKLMDRGIRLVSEIGGIDYKTACIKIYEALEELEKVHDRSQEATSVVQYVLKRLQK
ncbi:MAG: sugar phosphate isomerase [Lentisphaeria bacterium]|nr:sugar phosphate isomerase [Lentisphaeria bacterium]